MFCLGSPIETFGLQRSCLSLRSSADMLVLYRYQGGGQGYNQGPYQPQYQQQGQPQYGQQPMNYGQQPQTVIVREKKDRGCLGAWYENTHFFVAIKP